MADVQRETLMVKYLLRDLPESERAQFEEQYFADGEFFEELVGVENDLIDAYVRGRLPESQRTQFELHYLATVERRERVDFSRVLMEYVSKSAKLAPLITLEAAQLTIGRTALAPEAAVPTPQKPGAALPARERIERQSIWRRIFVPLYQPNPARRAVFALGAVAIIIFGSWMAVQNARLRHDLVQVRNENTLIQQDAARVKHAASETSTLALTASLTLTPGLSRGLGLQPGSGIGQPRSPLVGGARVIVILPSTSRVQVALELENDVYPSYSAVVQAPDGNESWQKRGLKSQPNHAGIKIVVMDLPADFFKTGDYVVELSGVSSDGTSHTLSSYGFHVDRQ